MKTKKHKANINSKVSAFDKSVVEIYDNAKR